MKQHAILFLSLLCHVLAGQAGTASFFDASVAHELTQLRSPSAAARAEAAERLGYLRAYNAADALASLLEDGDSAVRREAALALAWCGGRAQISILVDTLADADWSVAQAAWVALTNLTGMEFPFNADTPDATRRARIETWREWWDSVPADRPPGECLAMLGNTRPSDLAAGRPVAASSTYKGPPTVLTDTSNGAFWQTKQVPFPQHCTVDLGTEHEMACVVVRQYGPGFRMTDYELATSLDGTTFDTICRKKGLTPTSLVATFTPRKARHVRVISYATENPTYPTTFYAVSVHADPIDLTTAPGGHLGTERALRALGALGGNGACERVVETMTPYVATSPRDASEKLMAQAGIRTLGRLGGDKARALLVSLLRNTYLARYAADALGELGDAESAAAMISTYPDYCMSVAYKKPAKLPRDDRPGFEAVDRAYETPHALVAALDRCRLSPENVDALREIAPLLVANLSGDYDGAMLYEPEAAHQATGALLDRAGLRQAICEIAFQALGRPHEVVGIPETTAAQLLALARKNPGGTSFAATWLAALCRDKSNVPHLVALLEHPNGWARINAAKALMFMDARTAAEPIARLLAASKTEAEHGYFGGFLFKKRQHQGQDDYNAPSPCWREAFTRALGQLGDKRHLPLLVKLLNDDRNVLEVQYSAADSLARLGTPAATRALTEAASSHPFHSIRLRAREALWRQGSTTHSPAEPDVPGRDINGGGPPSPLAVNQSPMTVPLVFIRGANNMPNDFQIDIWRQAYSTTDSGPTYRLGHNLYRLAPAATNGTVTQLTHFSDGYVADCEVSWDGTRIVFARREQETPWWHIHEVNADGSGLRRLTHGPYHDVQPAYLPDGRIVFSSSRAGYRDEYHGYPATGLTVMNPDGSGIHCIGFNLGRDNEPSVLPDGRILFSRLELFYSRLKTEITVQAVFPDGTGNETLYGPERRDFWRNITRLSKERGWGEAPPRHRVLRLTQPQPFGRNQVICATTGGATIVGPHRRDERIVPRWENMAVTSPFPLPDGRVLCAATKRTSKRNDVNLGIYLMDPETGRLELVYDHPMSAEFEARPIAARQRPPVRPSAVPSRAFSAYLLCESARTSQELLTRQRGKLVRIVEGQPITARHHTHRSSAGQAWKNHVGTLGRILGTVPLAADGSFYVEIPADRLVHCQVLDSDRRVVGNQLIWMYARPRERKSCVGCHEMPGMTPIAGTKPFSLSARKAPLPCLPRQRAFTYRAKAWQKGRLADETEERTRTVRAVNLAGRY